MTGSHVDRYSEFVFGRENNEFWMTIPNDTFNEMAKGPHSVYNLTRGIGCKNDEYVGYEKIVVDDYTDFKKLVERSAVFSSAVTAIEETGFNFHGENIKNVMSKKFSKALEWSRKMLTEGVKKYTIKPIHITWPGLAARLILRNYETENNLSDPEWTKKVLGPIVKNQIIKRRRNHLPQI